MKTHEELIKFMDELMQARSRSKKTIELTRSLTVPDLEKYSEFSKQATIACKSLIIFLPQVFIPMEIYSKTSNENLKERVEVIKLAHVFNDRSHLLSNLKASAATVDRVIQDNEFFLYRLNMTDALSHYNGMRHFLNGLVSYCDKMLKDENLEEVVDLQAYKEKQFKEFSEFIESSFTNLVVNAPAYNPAQPGALEGVKQNETKVCLM